MTTRIALLGPLCCATLIGVGADQAVRATANPEDQEVPQLPSLTHFRVIDLELPPDTGRPFDTVVSLDNEQYTLTLGPYSLRADDFRLLVQGADGKLREVDAPSPATLRGHVQGVARSRVAASLIDGQLSATIDLDGQVWVIEPLARLTGRWAPQAAHVIYRGRDIAPLWPNFCGVEDIQPVPQGGQQVDGQGGVAGTGMKIIDLGADADFEFYQKNGNSVSSTMFDIETVMNSVENIYESQTNLTYEITTIVVRTVSGAPYTSSSCGSLLNQFINAWNTSPESSIRRDVAQLFTGKNLSGCLGIAVTPAACNIPNAYSLVESRAPGLPFIGRVGLSAHELGHNLNALHCCGSCSGCGSCRIMCPCIGGCSGIVTSFAAGAINAIVNYSNAVSCLADLPEPLDPPFFDDFPGPGSVPDPEKWIYNDGAFASVNAENEPSGERSLNLDASGVGEYQDDEIRSNVINLAGTSGNVFSYYTQHRGVEEGEQLFAEYWVESILRWIPLNIITSDGVDQDTFTFHSHDLAGGAENNEFRIRFRVEVNNLNDDWYIDDVFVGQPSVCPGDLDGDGSVGILDLLALLAAWGSDPGGPPDFDNDGDVGILDLLILLAAWGPCP